MLLYLLLWAFRVPPCPRDSARGPHARVCVLSPLLPRSIQALTPVHRFTRPGSHSRHMGTPGLSARYVQARPAPPPAISVFPRVARGFPGPLCPSCLPVTCASMVLSRVSVPPHPVTHGHSRSCVPGEHAEDRVLPQCQLPAGMRLAEVQVGRRPAAPSPECMARWFFMGLLHSEAAHYVALNSLSWKLVAFCLLASLAPGPPLHSPPTCPHPQIRPIPPLRPLLVHGEGQISFLTHPRAARHLCRHHLTCPRMAGEGPH